MVTAVDLDSQAYQTPWHQSSQQPSEGDTCPQFTEAGTEAHWRPGSVTGAVSSSPHGSVSVRGADWRVRSCF